MITIKNGYKDGWAGHYIGRAGKGKAGSALANPFVLKDNKNDAERSLVIAQYRKWLWQQMQVGNSSVMAELTQLKDAAATGDVSLVCFCFPKRCHGEVIEKAIGWMLDQEF